MLVHLLVMVPAYSRLINSILLNSKLATESDRIIYRKTNKQSFIVQLIEFIRRTFLGFMFIHFFMMFPSNGRFIQTVLLNAKFATKANRIILRVKLFKNSLCEINDMNLLTNLKMYLFVIHAWQPFLDVPIQRPIYPDDLSALRICHQIPMSNLNKRGTPL